MVELTDVEEKKIKKDVGKLTKKQLHSELRKSRKQYIKTYNHLLFVMKRLKKRYGNILATSKPDKGMDKERVHMLEFCCDPRGLDGQCVEETQPVCPNFFSLCEEKLPPKNKIKISGENIYIFLKENEMASYLKKWGHKHSCEIGHHRRIVSEDMEKIQHRLAILYIKRKLIFKKCKLKGNPHEHQGVMSHTSVEASNNYLKPHPTSH